MFVCLSGSHKCPSCIIWETLKWRPEQEIPPSATLEFTIHLFPDKTGAAEGKPSRRKQEHASSGKLAGEEQRLLRAKEAKTRGNGLVKIGDYATASAAYREALMLLQPAQTHAGDVELLREGAQLRAACLLNLSQCFLKLDDPAAAARHATDALDLEPSSCKALYRRAQAHLASGSLPEAKDDLLAALQREPQNREVRERLEECRKRLQEAAEWHRQAFGGLFGKAPEQRSMQRSAESLEALPRVWMHIQIGAKLASRLEIILYQDTVPRTAENFLRLCTGELGLGKRARLHYRHSPIHRVVAPVCTRQIFGHGRTMSNSTVDRRCSSCLQQAPRCQDALLRAVTFRTATAAVASPFTDRTLVDNRADSQHGLCLRLQVLTLRLDVVMGRSAVHIWLSSVCQILLMCAHRRLRLVAKVRP